MTATKRPQGVSDKVKAIVRERDRERCVRCGAHCTDGVPGLDWSLHHRRPKGMGGSTAWDTHLPANLIVLCGSGTTGCHGWVTAQPALAKAEGWLVSQYADPATTPLTRRGWVGQQIWAVQDNNGGVRATEVWD